MIIHLDESISQKQAWEIIKPVCRELYDLVNAGNIQFASGIYNESNGTYKINLKCSRIHLASRGFKDSIGDIEYEEGNIRIGLRANGIPANLFIELI
jgi:hypothetical protein